MAPVIDFHVHVFPDPIGDLLSQLPVGEQIKATRKLARSWLRPISGGLHAAQAFTRLLPEFSRPVMDNLGSLVTIPPLLLLEATAEDLDSAMEESGVDAAVVIAHPPLTSNEHVLELCSGNSKLIPAVNIPVGTLPAGKSPKTLLKRYAAKGAKILKIHAAAYGADLESPHYKVLLQTATELGMPVILHTGCMHMNLYYRKPKLGEAQAFESWFRSFPETRFILAHMNYHEPQVAMDLAETYQNIYLDTSWQPAEVIGEAARRVGPERILFGTDWPIIGQNMITGLKRIENCVQGGILNEDEANAIRGGNAAKLLGREPN